MIRLACVLAGAAALVGAGVSACAPDASGPQARDGGMETPVFHAGADPDDVLGWGQFRIEAGRLILNAGVTPYALNTALFTDHALKLRTLWLPGGADPAAYDEREAFGFPVGTVITKTFYYPRAGGGFERVARAEPMAHFDGRALDLSQVRLIETRVLVRRDAGWDAIPYVWAQDQSSAPRERIGAFIALTLAEAGAGRAFDYMVPNVNQCAGCHETESGAGIRPIGPKARHLNRDFDYASGTENQLDYWRDHGLLQGGPAPEAAPANASWHGEDIPLAALDAAARSYLDINCAHCHSRTGPADTSGLYLEPWEPAGPNLGVCKPPIAAGRGTGGRRFSIVPGDADASILHHRVASDRADIMMPELGRALIHEEGADLLAAWIESLPGDCG